MTQTLTVRFTGNDIKPDTLRSHELGEVIAAYEEALAAMVVREHRELKREQVVVGLVKIEHGSVGLTFSAPLGQPVYRAAVEMVAAIQNSAWGDLPGSTLRSLGKILKFVSKQNCVAHLHIAYEGERVSALITPKTAIPSSISLPGQTELVAEVKRVGGVEPKVMLQTLDGETLFCDTTEAIAKQLGNYLYERVRVAGNATWDYETLDIIDFEITDVLPYHHTSPTKAFAEIREKFGKYFDAIDDPEVWVQQLRNDEGR